jgi:hypothetical protein
MVPFSQSYLVSYALTGSPTSVFSGESHIATHLHYFPLPSNLSFIAFIDEKKFHIENLSHSDVLQSEAFQF